MHVNEVKYFDAIPIDSYGPGFFRIEGKILKSGIVCSRSGVYSWKGYKDLNILEELQYKIDVLFVGTGNEICQVPESFRKRLQEIVLSGNYEYTFGMPNLQRITF